MMKLIAVICLMSISLPAFANLQAHVCYSDSLRNSLNEKLQISDSQDKVILKGKTPEGRPCEAIIEQYKRDDLTTFSLELNTINRKLITTKFLVTSGVYADDPRYRSGTPNLEYYDKSDSDLYIKLGRKVCNNNYYFLTCDEIIQKLNISELDNGKSITLINSLEDYPEFFTKKIVTCLVK